MLTLQPAFLMHQRACPRRRLHPLICTYTELSLASGPLPGCCQNPGCSRIGWVRRSRKRKRGRQHGCLRLQRGPCTQPIPTKRALRAVEAGHAHHALPAGKSSEQFPIPRCSGLPRLVGKTSGEIDDHGRQHAGENVSTTLTGPQNYDLLRKRVSGQRIAKSISPIRFDDRGWPISANNTRCRKISTACASSKLYEASHWLE